MDASIVKTIAITSFFILVLVVLPIVALLLEHQRKMARLMRGEKLDDDDHALATLVGAKSDPNPALERRVTELEAEVATLRATLPVASKTADDSVRELA